MLIKDFVNKTKNDKIKNEELIIGLRENNFSVVTMTIFKLIERQYCNDEIEERLVELGELLEDNKFMGPWQFGHIAIATLSLVGNDNAKNRFECLYKKLDENDRFLVDNFIKSETYKM